MALVDNLSKTTKKLIDKYGSTVTFTLDVQSGGYDPITDSFATTTTTIVTKGIKAGAVIDSDKSVTDSIMIVYNANITQDFSVDGNNIKKIEHNTLQDKSLVTMVYI